MLRRLMAPVVAVLLALSGSAAAQADPTSGEVSGEAYFVLADSVVIQEIVPSGDSGWYRDQITLPAEGYLNLPSGEAVGLDFDTVLRRVFNQTFLDYLVALDAGDLGGIVANGDWAGTYVGPMTMTLTDAQEEVTCTGQAVGTFGPEFQSPGRAQLRCSDGSHLSLDFNGSPELYGAGFDDITGEIRY